MSQRLMYSPILLRSIAQVLLQNHLPSQDLESGDTTNWLEFDENLQGGAEDLFRGLEGLGLPNHSLTGRRRLRKSHSKSEVHLLSCQLDMEADRARKEGSVISQLQNVGEQQRFQNRKAIKALIRCTHFLAHQHIAHTTNFDKLVELVVSYGGETLQTFLDKRWRKCNVHLRNGCSRVCECSWNMGGQVSTKVAS